jgi:predicted metal-dependent HD superfamily phosphohydrolase
MTDENLEAHVRQLFETYFDPKLIYHNLEHTLSVVKRAMEIADHELPVGYSPRVLKVAAWFHDTGHLTGPAKGHETRSVIHMRAFFLSKNEAPEFLDRVQECIMATKLPGEPGSMEEKIICDADLYHLGTAKFFEANNNVKREIELRTGVVQTCWDESSLKFLKKHHYYTAYCQTLLQPGLHENIALLENRVMKAS